MKPLVWAFLFLVAAAGAPQVFADGGVPDDDPVRRRPPARFTIASYYQEWTREGRRLRALSFPLTAQVHLQPNLGLSVGVSQAVADGDGLEQVSGMTDVYVAVDYVYRFRTSRLRVNLGVNVPTGTSGFSEAAYETAFQVGLRPYAFRVPYFGQGAIVAPGIAWSVAVTEGLVLGVGAAYRFRGSFDPVENLPAAYDWGDEVPVTVSGVWQVSRTVTFSADAVFTSYNADRIGDSEVYDAGNRFTAQVALHKRLRRHDLQVAARYQDVAPNRVRTGDTLRPESEKSYPGYMALSGRYRLRLSPALRATLHAEGIRYQAAFDFGQTDVYRVGVAPELSLLPAVTIPVLVRYAFGDLSGLEAGIGLVAVL